MTTTPTPKTAVGQPLTNAERERLVQRIQPGGVTAPFAERVNLPLFETVLQCIERHAIAFEMNVWMTGDLFTTNGRPLAERIAERTGHDELNCGSAACLAGWTIVAHHHLAPLAPLLPVYDQNIAGDARLLLGLTNDEAPRLFLVPQWPQPFQRNYLNEDDADVRYEGGQRLLEFEDVQGHIEVLITGEMRRRNAELTIRRVRFFLATQGTDES